MKSLKVKCFRFITLRHDCDIEMKTYFLLTDKPTELLIVV